MIDLDAVRARYSKALDAKPSKGPMTPDGIAAITDSVADIPDLLHEVERLMLADTYEPEVELQDLLSEQRRRADALEGR